MKNASVSTVPKATIAQLATAIVPLVGALAIAIALLAPAPLHAQNTSPVNMDDVRAHGRDERIRIEAFFEGQEFLYRLVKELSGGGLP